MVRCVAELMREQAAPRNHVWQISADYYILLFYSLVRTIAKPLRSWVLYSVSQVAKNELFLIFH